MIPLNLSTKRKTLSSYKIVNESLLNENNNSHNEFDETKHTIDSFLSKIETTSYHKHLLVSLILIFMADGAEMVVIALTIDCIQKEYKLGITEKGLLGSVVFFGLLIGNLSSSKICDSYGRKKIIIFGAGMICIFAFLTALSPNYFTLVLFRGFLGVGIGIVIPSATSLVSETVPIEERSFYLNNIWLAFPIGEIYVYLISYFALSGDINCQRWRWVLCFSAIPTFFSFLLLLNLKESPRFLILNGQFEEGFKILDELGAFKNMRLTEIEKRMIQTETLENQTNKIEMKFNSLWNLPEYKKVSLQLWAMWFFVSVIFYGGLYIFPQILKEIQKEKRNNENLYFDLIVTSVFFIPITLVSGFLSDQPKLGRKYSMIIGFGLCFLVSFICLLLDSISYITYSFMRFGIGISFSVIGVYTSEIYPTKIRTLGNSAGNAFTRIGGIISPFIMEFLFKNLGYKSPIYIFAICSAICAFICNGLQIETYKKGLDFSVSKELNRRNILL